MAAGNTRLGSALSDRVLKVMRALDGAERRLHFAGSKDIVIRTDPALTEITLDIQQQP